METLLKECECGCGRYARPGKWFIHGHYWKGKHHSEEHNRKIGLGNKGFLSPNYGKPNPHSEETKRRMGLAQKGKHHSEETKRKLSLAKKGKHHSEETKRKISLANKGKRPSEETKRKISLAKKGPLNHNYGKHHSEETKRKSSLSHKKRWLDPIFAERNLKALFAASGQRPNKSEKRLRKILNRLFPGEYKYVGDGDVWIGGKNPDFININGQKKTIELFGDYWHSKKYTGLLKKVHRKQRQDHFAKYGYKTCVVWQYELEDGRKLKEKLLTFHAK